jgi:hypothetical protein
VTGKTSQTISGLPRVISRGKRSLMATWCDPHAERFEREVLAALDQDSASTLDALREAESELARAEQALRGAGESPLR